MAITAEDLHGLVLVRDCLDADGAFMLVHLLKLALGLDGQHNVLLVACRHTAVHYAHVLRKSGLAMASLVEAGRLAVVDSLRPPPPVQAGAQLTSLQALHRRIARAAAALQSGGQRPLLLALDDLTVSPPTAASAAVSAGVCCSWLAESTCCNPCAAGLALRCRLRC